MIYLPLIHNIALLGGLTFVHSLMLRRLKRDRLVYPLLSGLLFGFVCVIGMMIPVTLQPGLIFDGRSIILGIAGLFAGPVAALIAGAIAAAYRLWLGGIGGLPGVGTIVGAAGFGVVWHYLGQRQQWAMRTSGLFVFGLLVHLLLLAILLLTLPEAPAQMILNSVALPMLLIYTLATLLICMLFLMVEQQIHAEEALIQSEKRMRLFFERQLVGMAITSPDKGWVQVNDKLCQMLGYTREELATLSWTELTHPDDLAGDIAKFNRLLSGEINDYAIEKRFIHKDGAVIHTNLSVGCVRQGDGSVDYVLAILEDITEQRAMQDELLKNHKLESLSVLAGGIAHDFNNILTGIMGNISFASMSLATPDKAQKLLENAEKASLRAASLAAQLLTFAKGGKPVKKKVSVGAILEESLSLSLRGANVKGVIEIPERLNTVEADEGQLSQVFNNLIINALQAMPGGGTLTIRGENITLGDNNRELLPPGNYVKLTFADQGCGIPEEDLGKIFDPYFTTKSEGSGLGLASTHSIISKHDGRIDARSVVGKGATFTIYLHSLGAANMNNYISAGSPAAERLSTRAILVLDDDELIRDLVTEVLEYLGYQVKTCANGKDAVMMYKAAKESGAPFFAAIMDLTIPGGMGGKEAAEQILNYDPSARLIVSSGYSNDPVIAEYGSYGFSAAITKPYKVDNIAEILTELSNRA